MSHIFDVVCFHMLISSSIIFLLNAWKLFYPMLELDNMLVFASISTPFFYSLCFDNCGMYIIIRNMCISQTALLSGEPYSFFIVF